MIIFLLPLLFAGCHGKINLKLCVEGYHFDPSVWDCVSNSPSPTPTPSPMPTCIPLPPCIIAGTCAFSGPADGYCPPEPSPTPSPTSIPTAQPTATPAPATTPTPVPPDIFFWKVGGLNQPITQYRCQNPQDGPKFQQQNICNVGSTTYLYDPAVPNVAGPCDEDHQQFWTTFCHFRDWDDPRGPAVEVTGAEFFEPDSGNPYNTLVTFKPGVPFTICTYPRKDVQTIDGIHLNVRGDGKTCTEHKYK